MSTRKVRNVNKKAEFVHFEGCLGRCRPGTKVTKAQAMSFMDGISDLADVLGLCVSAGSEMSNRTTPSWERRRGKAR